MENVSGEVKKQIRNIRFWWMISLLGVYCSMLGLTVWLNPRSSYDILQPALGILFAASAITILLNTCVWHKLIWLGRLFVYAVLSADILAGILLLMKEESLSGFPVMACAAWLFLHGVVLIYLGYRIRRKGDNGWSFAITSGVLFLLFAAIVLVRFATSNIAETMQYVAVSLIIAGVSTVAFSVHARQITHSENDTPDTRGSM
ncbi:MAG: DUF308 domain-containing protein [Rikenellaceae bacterium]|nr:DUF308 domain-containing protein [Rikenellaceae bacterium]MDE7356285.1 DUF308 domain-containing protein [Rikenellaceae bacterium]